MADDTAPIWHVAKGNQKLGVFTSQQLARMGVDGRITSDMKVWKSGMPEWQLASKVKGLRVLPALDEPPPLVAERPTTSAALRAPVPPTVMTGHVTIEKTSKAIKREILMCLGALVVGLLFLSWGAMRLLMVPDPSLEDLRSGQLTGQQADALRDARLGAWFVIWLLGIPTTVGGFFGLIYTWLKRWWEHG